MKNLTKGIILVGIIISLLFLVNAAGTTLRGNTLTYDSPGQVNTLENISLTGTPLMITDSETGSLIAVLNAPLTFTPNAVSQMASNFTLGFPNTSTSFLGDINNFDDIDGVSRFRETNINNGTSAAAGFVGVNNIGNFFSLGIGSSNFEFFGERFPNEVALFGFTNGSMNFINSHLFGWEWKSNLDNSTTSFNFISPMELSGEGNLHILGNYTGEHIQLNSIENKDSCDNESEGTIVYEGNGTSGDFFGCTRLNAITLIWRKF